MSITREVLIGFMDKYGPQLVDLKVQQANVRAYEKDLKGSDNEPSEYTMTLNEIRDSLDTISKTFSHQTDPQIKVVNNGITILDSMGRLTTLTKMTRETTNYAKMIDQLIIDGILTHDVVNKYKEMNKSISSYMVVK